MLAQGTAVSAQGGSGRALQVLGKGRAEMLLVTAAAGDVFVAARAALPGNPHVADGFLTEKPTSPQSRSSLNLPKPIMLMGCFFPSLGNG